MGQERLTYEQILGELQALLGRQVSVRVTIEHNGHEQPLATFGGILERGHALELPPMTDYPSGESVLFAVRAEPATQLPAAFMVTKASYIVGDKEDDDRLRFKLSEASIEITSK